MKLRLHRLSMDVHGGSKTGAPGRFEPATPGLEGETRVAELATHQSLTQGAMPRCHARSRSRSRACVKQHPFRHVAQAPR
jgi:hypothetical protein